MAVAYGNVYVAQIAMGALAAADAGRLPRGRGARGPVAHHRLQPLHRPRHQHALRHAAAEARGRLRALAALSLPAGWRRPRGTRSSCSTRTAPSIPLKTLRVQRDSLQDAVLHEAGGGAGSSSSWRRRMSTSAGASTRAWRNGGRRRSREARAKPAATWRHVAAAGRRDTPVGVQRVSGA